MAYRPRRRSASRFASVRGLKGHLRVWEAPAGRPVVMIHGGRDASATFQFLVDGMSNTWHVMAPDLRGHGLSAPAPDLYWFQDYLADLDAWLDLISPEVPAVLLGHSLGGNIACAYAGVRPERVSHLISLDGFGLPDRAAEDAPRHLARWLDSLRTSPAERVYPDHAALADRLMQANPRLERAKALFLAEHVSRPAPGGCAFAFDPAHRRPFAPLFRRAEWLATLAAIRAPTLWIGSATPFPPGLAAEEGGIAARLAAIPDARFVRIPGSGHNLHHEAPDALAVLIESFLAAVGPTSAAYVGDPA